MLYLEVETGGHRFALPLETIERVARAVATTPVTPAPRSVLGVVNVHGEVRGVLSLRRIACLEDRPLRPADRLVMIRLRRRTIALLVDGVHALREIDPAALTSDDALAPPASPLRGVVPLPDGLLLVQDPDRFLSLEDEALLEEGLETHRDGA
ncbi:MAG: chemotaxis protein CheW [Methanospirillum sp.]